MMAEQDGMAGLQNKLQNLNAKVNQNVGIRVGQTDRRRERQTEETAKDGMAGLQNNSKIWTQRLTKMLASETDRRTTSFHRTELLCNSTKYLNQTLTTLPYHPPWWHEWDRRRADPCYSWNITIRQHYSPSTFMTRARNADPCTWRWDSQWNKGHVCTPNVHVLHWDNSADDSTCKTSKWQERIWQEV